ncbi:MAG: tRNA (adenosine(37)-N6)-threonylcarbamoyltransferase complex ATPase subunit type 1 TsaE [Desulfobacteraceae bacterium]|nr:tRNA (adenosine(37)-N6)-threonylcarbamoyltransferase complex ATPase subunit type 1 TsaE [Desulfobacteraceae bacterium]
MNIIETRHIKLSSPGETTAFGEKLGGLAYPGLFIALSGNLGSGKTTFAKGFARGISVPPEYYVTSPTYTLINEYPGKYTFCHVDLYRLSGFADIEEIGLYDILVSDAVVLVEWPDRMHESDLPAGRLVIEFTIQDKEARHIVIKAYGLNATNLLKTYGNFD